MLHAASIVYDVEIREVRSDSQLPMVNGCWTVNHYITLGFVSCMRGEVPTHYVSIQEQSKFAIAGKLCIDLVQ